MGTSEAGELQAGQQLQGHASPRDDLALHSRAGVDGDFTSCIIHYSHEEITQDRAIGLQMACPQFLHLLSPLTSAAPAPTLLKKNAECVLETRG